MSTQIRFDESHYFICTGGLKPARFKAKPAMTYRGDGNYYLNFKSRTCKGMDFSCRYIALYGAILGALIAALCATGAGALLVGALIGAAVFAVGSTALSVCGTMVAIMRNWERNTWTWGTNVEKYAGVANRKPPHLTCTVLFSNTISFAPNVTSEFHALALFAVNIVFTGLEGFMCVYGFKGLGVLLKSPTQFLINFGANYLKSWTKKGIAVRAAFGLWGGFDAYSKSSNKMTAGEALTSGEVWLGAAGGFGFIESAIVHAAQGDPVSIMFLLTMGSGAKPNDQKKFMNVARQFRQHLRTLKNGVGAKESITFENVEIFERMKSKPVNSRFGDTIGKYSGRPFFRNRSGGKIQKLSWKNAKITKEGIEIVKKQVGRFESDPANIKMIERLEAIERGEIKATDYDFRFYTHEIREAQRLKNMGMPEGEPVTHEEWNDAHTATLEDFKINEKTEPIYHPDALLEE